MPINGRARLGVGQFLREMKKSIRNWKLGIDAKPKTRTREAGGVGWELDSRSLLLSIMTITTLYCTSICRENRPNIRARKKQVVQISPRPP